MRRHKGMTVPALIGIASALPPPTFAQGENVENPSLPRTADGKPTLLRRRRGRQTGNRTCPKGTSSA
jgi:hypothetical protein